MWWVYLASTSIYTVHVLVQIDKCTWWHTDDSSQQTRDVLLVHTGSYCEGPTTQYVQQLHTGALPGLSMNKTDANRCEIHNACFARGSCLDGLVTIVWLYLKCGLPLHETWLYERHPQLLQQPDSSPAGSPPSTQVEHSRAEFAPMLSLWAAAAGVNAKSRGFPGPPVQYERV